MLKSLLDKPFWDVESLYASGIVTEKVWKRYLFFWTWAAARFSGEAARKQERAYQALGSEAFYRRREKIRGWMAKL